MTDDEIIKALECCGFEYGNLCSVCPKYEKDNDFCQEELHNYAIDLINRQKAEIEKYKNNCEKCGAKTRECIESLHNIIAEQQAEIKELNTIRSRLIYDSGTLTKIYDELYQKIKAKAVKEFAEKLKNTYFIDSERLCCQVDKVLKEMAGDTE